MTEYTPEAAITNEMAKPCDVIPDPEFYRDIARAPGRRNRLEFESRAEHIWGGHGHEFALHGYESFDQVLPVLVDIASSDDAQRVNSRGKTIHSKGLYIVITKNDPFQFHGPLAELNVPPPKPPIIVTAYTVRNEARAKRILAKAA